MLLNSYTRSLHCLTGFSVLSWNVLADGFFNEESFPKVEYIPFKERFNLIREHIRSYNSSIVSLYEVDNFEDYSDFLEKEGYLVHYNSVKDRTFKDTTWGIVVAVRASDWKVLGYDQKMFKDSTAQQYWVLKLENNKTKNKLTLISTHLISKVFNEQPRIAQAKQLAELITQLNSQEPEVPIVLVGDLNAEPTYQSFKILKELPLHDKSTLQSAYSADQWTTCKQRAKLQLRVIDYILYSGLSLIAIDNPPKEKSIVVKGLPDRHMPSDHLPLFAIFTFK